MSRVTVLVFVILLTGCGGQESVTVDNAWVRQAPPGVTMTAAYARIRNDTDATVSITGARADGFGIAEIHRTIIEDGIVRMRHVETLTIPAGETALLEPGGLHLMLMNAERDPVESVVVELLTDDGGTLRFEAPVRMPGTTGR